MESSNILQVAEDLLRTGKYSDFTIQCEGQVFKVHRAIVCSQSRFLDAAICGEFREAFENRLDLPDDDANVIRCLISYLYSGDYKLDDGDLTCENTDIAEDVQTENIDDISGDIAKISEAQITPELRIENAPCINLGVYIAADKFGIDPLKKIAKDRLAKWLNSHWSKESFPETAKYIVESSPPHEMELRELVVHVIAENIQELINHGPIYNFLESSGDLATSVLKVVTENWRTSEAERERLLSLCEEDSFGDFLESKMNELRRCRHCQAGFNLRVENRTMYFGSIRCGLCATRH